MPFRTSASNVTKNSKGVWMPTTLYDQCRALSEELNCSITEVVHRALRLGIPMLKREDKKKDDDIKAYSRASGCPKCGDIGHAAI
jgi:hypothetical protein